MANVEIHGLNVESAEKLRTRVFNLFAHVRYADDLVVTIYPTNVMNRDGIAQPFIRLVNPDNDDYEAEFVACLHSLDVDLELLRLSKFIPKDGS